MRLIDSFKIHFNPSELSCKAVCHISTPDDVAAVQKFIKTGMKPLEAWRYNCQLAPWQVAEAIGMDENDYIDLELGKKAMNDEDIYSLSAYLGISPCDLDPTNRDDLSLPQAVACLRRMDDFEPHSVERFNLAYYLQDMALPTRSVEALINMKEGYQNLPSHELVILFIEELLLRDQNIENKIPLACLERPEALAEKFIEDHTRRSRRKDTEYISAKKREKAAYADFDNWGQRLFAETAKTGLPWSEAKKKIEILAKPDKSSEFKKIVLFGKPHTPDQIAKIYANFPETLGLHEWPKVRKNDFNLDGQYLGSWKNAHNKHAQLLKTYLRAQKNANEVLIDGKRLKGQLNTLKKWVQINSALLEAYCVRQVIKSHCEIDHTQLMPKLTKKQQTLLLPPPRRNCP